MLPSFTGQKSTPGTNMKHQKQGAWRYYDNRLIKINFSIIDNPTLDILISNVKSVHAYRLFLYLLRHVNGRIEYPENPNSGILMGEKQLMEKLDFSRSTLYRAKGELEKMGIIKRAKKANKTIVHFSCVTPDTQVLIHCRSEKKSNPKFVDNSVENSPTPGVTPDTQKDSGNCRPTVDPDPIQPPKTGEKVACQVRPYIQDQEIQDQLPPKPPTGELELKPPVDSHLIGALLRIITEQQKVRKAKGIPFYVNDVLQDWITDPNMTAHNLAKPRDNLVLQSGKKGSMIEIVGRYFGPKRKRDIVRGIKHLWTLMTDTP